MAFYFCYEIHHNRRSVFFWNMLSSALPIAVQPGRPTSRLIYASDRVIDDYQTIIPPHPPTPPTHTLSEEEQQSPDPIASHSMCDLILLSEMAVFHSHFYPRSGLCMRHRERERGRERERERQAASWPAFSLLAPLAANVKLSIYHHAPRLTQDVFVCVSGFSLTLLDDFSAPKRYFWAVSLKLSRGK